MAALSLARMTAGVLDKADIGSLRPAPRFARRSAQGSIRTENSNCRWHDGGLRAGSSECCGAGFAAWRAHDRGRNDQRRARFTTDIGTILLGAGRAEADVARRRANKIWPSIVGFVVGSCIGAICEVRYGLIAVALPTGLALIAFAMAWAAPFRQARQSVTALKPSP
jgi:hypothetical protein